MTQYLTKFEGWRTASFAQDDDVSAATGWTTRYAPSLPPARISTHGINAKSYGWSSRALLFASSSWDLIDADANRANVELLAGVVASSIGYLSAGFTIDRWRVIARGATGATTYYAAQLEQDGTLSLLKVIAGVETTLASVALTALSSPYRSWLRLRVNGTALSAKAWAVNDAEPGAWSVTATDSAITGVGFVGLLGSAFEFLSVGSNGDAALAPRTLTAADDQLCRANTDGKPLVCTLDLDHPGSNGVSGAVTGRVVRRYANVAYDSGSVAPIGGLVYPARVAAIPSLSRELDEAAGGTIKVGGADFELENTDGALDDLTRTWLLRAPVTARLGLTEWPWYDLLPYLVGSVAAVSANNQAVTLGVDTAIRGLDGDITASIIASGPNAGKPAPQLYGRVYNASPVLIDAANLVYQYHDGANRHITQVRDRGVSLASPATLTLTAFDAAADTLTASAAHGRAVGDLVVIGGTPPAPLVAGALYEIKTVPATDKITLTATRGGAMIDLTGASGAITATAEVRLWFGGVVAATGIVSPTGTITFARKPEGVVTFDAFEVPVAGVFYGPPLYPRAPEPFTSTENFSKLSGIPLPRLGVPTGDYGIVYMSAFLTERTARLTVLDMLVAGGVPLTASRSGTVSVRPIRFSAIERTLTVADCFGVPRLTKVLPASAIQIGSQNQTVMNASDFANGATPADVAKYGNAQISLAAGVGIDGVSGVVWSGLALDPALYREQQADASVYLATTTLTSAKARQRPAQVFEIVLRTTSMLLDPGDVVSLIFDRYFFKDVVNEIDVSPERPATAIGAQRQPSLAVVTKIVDDPANSRQTLTLYRPMPTLFPAS